MKLFPLKITSAIAVDGVIHRAGSIVSVAESVAKDLLRRGRAVVHTVAEVAEEIVADDTADVKSAKAPKSKADK